MMFVIEQDGEAPRFVSYQGVRKAFPHVCFPAEPDLDFLRSIGVSRVVPMPMPELLAGETATPGAPEPGAEGWVHYWTIQRRVIGEAEVREEGARRLRALVDGYSAEERETWAQQEAEARSFISDNGASVPMIAALAAADNRTVGEMAARVVSHAESFKAAAATILARQRGLCALARAGDAPFDYEDDRHWA